MDGANHGTEHAADGRFLEVDTKIFNEESRARRDRVSVNRRLEIGFAMLSDDYESGKEEVAN